ncbi:MAG: helix-turn-helix transcriptional regulator [Spirochaetota bacterium]
MKGHGNEGMGARKALSMNMKRLRAVQGLSQEDFAERADLSRPYVGDIERGSKFPSPEVLDRIATALGVAVAELFSVEGANLERLSFSQKVRERLHSSLDSAIDELSMESAKNKGSG